MDNNLKDISLHFHVIGLILCREMVLFLERISSRTPPGGVYKIHKFRVEVNFMRMSCIKSLLGVKGVIFRMRGWEKN